MDSSSKNLVKRIIHYLPTRNTKQNESGDESWGQGAGFVIWNLIVIEILSSSNVDAIVHELKLKLFRGIPPLDQLIYDTSNILGICDQIKTLAVNVAIEYLEYTKKSSNIVNPTSLHNHEEHCTDVDDIQREFPQILEQDLSRNPVVFIKGMLTQLGKNLIQIECLPSESTLGLSIYNFIIRTNGTAIGFEADLQPLVKKCVDQLKLSRNSQRSEVQSTDAPLTCALLSIIATLKQHGGKLILFNDTPREHYFDQILPAFKNLFTKDDPEYEDWLYVACTIINARISYYMEWLTEELEEFAFRNSRRAMIVYEVYFDNILNESRKFLIDVRSGIRTTGPYQTFTSILSIAYQYALKIPSEKHYLIVERLRCIRDILMGADTRRMRQLSTEWGHLPFRPQQPQFTTHTCFTHAFYVWKSKLTCKEYDSYLSNVQEMLYQPCSPICIPTRNEETFNKWMVRMSILRPYWENRIKCPCGDDVSESLEHALTKCPAYTSQRVQRYGDPYPNYSTNPFVLCEFVGLIQNK